MYRWKCFYNKFGKTIKENKSKMTIEKFSAFSEIKRKLKIKQIF